MGSFHQIINIDLNKKFLRIHNLSCFCRLCFNGRDDPCDNEAYVAPFNFVHLEPCNVDDVHAHVESML
jgi:hypothetical protein